MLNRRVQWTEEGIRISPNPRHVKEIIEELGLEGAKRADTPIIVSQWGTMDSDSRALSLRDAALYWSLVAKLAYLAMARPDIRYAASIVGSHASSPKDVDRYTSHVIFLMHLAHVFTLTSWLKVSVVRIRSIYMPSVMLCV